ncbi:ROK family transcriptional regulator [Timonella senegalensis]|uniref:ROK family transcriptional regulator n=1 Tax=Timonella senegalensis TaxID=1465825 RepID=UPI001C553D94
MKFAPRPTGAGEMFQLLRDGTPRTRSELATITGQARSTIAARIDVLTAAGLITSVGEASSTGGRRPATFAFNPTARIVLGVDLGASHARVAVADLAATIVVNHDEPLRIADGPEKVLARVIQLGKDLVAESGHELSDLAAVGIGLPGPVEHATGRPVAPPIMPGWDGYDVAGTLRRAFGAPVLVDNDVNLMAVGEQRTSWQEHTNMLFVKVATGIGSGIILDGTLRRGAQGAAGDIGHIALPGFSEAPCNCGNYGCLEAVAGGAALARALREKGLDVDGTAEVVAAVKDGNADARAAVRDAGREVGTILAGCVSMLNPSLVVVGGALVGAGEQLMAGIREVLYRRSLPLATEHLRVVTSQTRDSAGVLGGAYLAIDHVLSPTAIDALFA